MLRPRPKSEDARDASEAAVAKAFREASSAPTKEISRVCLVRGLSFEAASFSSLFPHSNEFSGQEFVTSMSGELLITIPHSNVRDPLINTCQVEQCQMPPQTPFSTVTNSQHELSCWRYQQGVCVLSNSKCILCTCTRHTNLVHCTRVE